MLESQRLRDRAPLIMAVPSPDGWGVIIRTDKIDGSTETQRFDERTFEEACRAANRWIDERPRKKRRKK